MITLCIQFSTYKEIFNQKTCPYIIILKICINLLVHEFRFQIQGHKFIQIQVIKDMNFQLAVVLKIIARVVIYLPILCEWRCYYNYLQDYHYSGERKSESELLLSQEKACLVSLL